MYSLCFVCNIKFFDIVAKTFAQQNICRQHKVRSLPKYASQLGNRGCWLFHVKHMLKLQELHIKIYKSMKSDACG